MQSNNQISEKQLKFGLWLAGRLKFFKYGLVLLLTVLSLLFWGYALYGFFDYLVFSAPKEKLLETGILQEAIDWPGIFAAEKPAPLEWSPPEVISGRNRSDTVLEIRNINSQWLARFSYLIGIGGQTEVVDDFVLPGGRKHIHKTFFDGKGSPVFSILNVNWQRIASYDAPPDYVDFSAERLDFIFENIKVFPGNGEPARIDFEAWNRSAYSFWEPRFNILFWRGEKLIGITSVTLPYFKSGERRHVSLVLFDRLGAVSKVDIAPDINILDNSVFMPP